MILFVDNYDSYVYNLVQLISGQRQDLWVVRNDALSLTDPRLEQVDRIILSPGPSGPAEAGVCNALIRAYGHRVPLLGVCLGHQCLGHVFGMTVRRADEVMHGEASQVFHRGEGLFAGLPSPLWGGRYHSLVVEGPVPDMLSISAWLEDGTIMGLSHRALPLFGLQFHPESILTPDGRTLLQAFLRVDGRQYPALGQVQALQLPAEPGRIQRFNA